MLTIECLYPSAAFYSEGERFASAGETCSFLRDAISFYLSRRNHIEQVALFYSGTLILFFKNGSRDQITGSPEDLLSLQQTLGFPV